jgi:hypothetical protein
MNNKKYQLRKDLDQVLPSQHHQLDNHPSRSLLIDPPFQQESGNLSLSHPHLDEHDLQSFNSNEKHEFIETPCGVNDNDNSGEF